MKQVKLILSSTRIDDEYGDEYSTIVTDSISDWETISDDEYQLLKDNMYRLQHSYTNNVVLLEKDSVPVIHRIASIREWIQAEREKDEKEKAERQAQQLERARKKMLKKAGDELKLLEELRAKYPDV